MMQWCVESAKLVNKGDMAYSTGYVSASQRARTDQECSLMPLVSRSGAVIHRGLAEISRLLFICERRLPCQEKCNFCNVRQKASGGGVCEKLCDAGCHVSCACVLWLHVRCMEWMQHDWHVWR